MNQAGPAQDPRQLPVLLDQVNTTGQGIALYDGNFQRPFDDEDVIDLRVLWRTVLRYRKLIGIIFSVVVITTLIGTILMRPMYTASVLMEINTGGRNLVKFQNIEEQDLATREYMLTQSRIMQSAAVATEVVRRLKLVDHPEFNGELNQRGLISGVRSIVRLLNPVEEEPVEDRELAAAGVYLDRLSIGQIRNSSLVNINFESFDPVLSAQIANEHADAYIWHSDERRLNSTSGAKAFLEREISNIQAKLETSEKQLTDFARKFGVVDVEDRNNIMMTRLSELNLALSTVQNQRIDAETQFIQSQSADVQRLSIVFDDPLIKALREEQAALQSEYLELSEIYKPAYPRMVQLKAKIDELEQSIGAQADKIVGGLATNYDQLVLREERLNEELDKLKTELLDLQDRAVTYNILKREWEANKELYAGLLERTKEVGVAAGMELNVGSVVDKATAPSEASSPNLMLNMLVAAALGLMGGLGAAFLLAMLDNTVNDVERLQEITRLGHLGVAPDIAEDESEEDVAQKQRRIDTIVHHQPDSAFAESIQSVRTSLSYARAGGFPKSVMVTSAIASEGKSTVAVNLAISCANAGKRVALVEADLRKSRHYKLFDAPAAPGLADYLVSGGAPKTYSVKQLGGMDVIVAGTKSPNPVDLLGSNEMRDLIKNLEEDYDVVLVDCPPILGLADAIIVSTMVEGVVFVVSAHHTPQDAIKNAIQRLRAVNAPLIGTVLNKVVANNAGYYYDYYNYNYSLENEEQTA